MSSKLRACDFSLELLLCSEHLLPRSAHTLCAGPSTTFLCKYMTSCRGLFRHSVGSVGWWALTFLLRWPLLRFVDMGDDIYLTHQATALLKA